jgi:hypothetical protein
MISLSFAEDSKQADALVSAIIAEFGFKTAIPWLLKTVSSLAGQSHSAPNDEAKRRRFLRWSQAVQSACTRHGVLTNRSFDNNSLSTDDAIWARRIGVRFN